jgi:hypothetical protein
MTQSYDIKWSKPINLSETPQLSTHPAIVADNYGYVHLFWSEEVGGAVRQTGDTGGAGNSILYRRWDGENWTTATDILFVPGENIAEYISVSVDSEDILHAVWTGQTNFYYSNATSWQADSAHAWRRPMVIATDSARSANESSIVAGNDGHLHFAYATRGDEAGIYYVNSPDKGKTWTSARKLSKPLLSSEISYSNVQLIIDGAGYLHLVWQTNQEEGYGQAVYYARSMDQGKSWSTPWQFGYRDANDIFVEWPYLAARGGNEVHLIYIDGGTQGRLHHISLDNGETWGEAQQIIPELEGINGYVFPIVDGISNMHLIANMRTRGDNVVGIYYARWINKSWSKTIPIDNHSSAAPSAHYTCATVRKGNEIYIAYNQISVGEIWMLKGYLPLVTPVPSHQPSQLKQGTILTPTPEGTLTPSTYFPRPTPLHLASTDQPQSLSEWHAVVLGLAASILLLCGVLVTIQVHRG